MKLCLNLLFFFCFSVFSAQHKASDSLNQKKTDAVNIHPKTAQSSSLDASAGAESKEYLRTSIKKTESIDETVADQNTSIVQEINAVLNYQLNRVWKRDLYCLVCENYSRGRMA